jgi:hypothetical protein
MMDGAGERKLGEWELLDTSWDPEEQPLQKALCGRR